ncbi:MAG: DUF4832 domain-containing protein [Roseburia sp.]|nr:DUF4832 domain-containing protein [Roseburia sp.]
MKTRKIILTIATCFAVLAGAVISACTVKETEEPQDYQPLNYSESTEKINNPDQGFYRPIYVKVTEDGVTYNKNIVTEATQLYHLRIDISDFSKAVNGNSDRALSPSALSGLKELLSYLKEKDKNAVVRFAYDPSFGGKKDKEPSLSAILNHISHLCPLFQGYENTVTAIEAGMIGPWGEMHSSKIANAAAITPVTDAFLSGTTDIPVLVRTPKMIYDYLGITINDIDDYTIESTAKAYRLGLYNDGYLGSDSDLGTYTDREREIEFLSGQTAHLPYGGEAVIPTSKLHDIDKCLPEMNKINLSYLNVEWNNQVIDKWKNSKYTYLCGVDKAYYGKSAFTYIENHMGYRFVLKKSVIGYSENASSLKVRLTFKNAGFGNLNRVKRAKLILVDGDGQVAAERNVLNFTGETDYGFLMQANLADGSYEVYLRFYGEESGGVPKYCLQFANDGLWSETLKANKIGGITVGK